jgi:hypothetical protein
MTISIFYSLFCDDGALDPHKAKGKILVCLRGDNNRVDKGVEASRVGAIGMILVIERESGGEVTADPHVLPASNVNFTDGSYILNYANKTE